MSESLLAVTLVSAVLVGIVACQGPAPRGSAPRDAGPAPARQAPAARGELASTVSLPPVPEERARRFTPEGLLAEGAHYLEDPGFRRRTLEASLANRDNTYARQRLESYGRGDRGWDLLPEWIPRTVRVTRDVADAVRAGPVPPLPDDARMLWDGQRPKDLQGWVNLGEQVFFGYPLRAEVFLEYALRHPELAEKVGVHRAGDGSYPGARLFLDDTGTPHIGLTCALCHTRVQGGQVIVGEARRDFDYGRLRLAYHQDTKEPVDPELARRMARWGPGRADVTEDETEDPVAIPDLWGLRHQTALTQAGTLVHVGPAVLAIRQETQLLHTNHQRVRPPRELAWALAMFLYSLDPPPAAEAATAREAEGTARGRLLFEDRCRSCHANEAFGGDPVDVGKVGTDPSLAAGRARGTGRYRPPALLRVGRAAPYFHDGSVPTLEDLLSPQRLAATYRLGSLGPGPVPGHTFGFDLSEEDRRRLVAYLRSL